ncbi:MAG: LysR family transcriptional regulator [Pseudomonadales bacterium]
MPKPGLSRAVDVVDSELARTFLAVVAAGNFSAAASRLFVTQSTVSARIASLEEQLGCRLFVRNKAGTTLTAEGRWFQPHAATLVRTVERVRHEIGVARGFRDNLTIGARIGLWEGLLLDALPRIRLAAPEVAIRSELGFEDELMQGLIEGRIDIGVMYTPQRRPGLEVRQLLEETLVLVATDPGIRELPGPGYVHIDWGPEFNARHSAAFPAYGGPALRFNVGWLGLQHILGNGGSGYFPLRLVRSHLDAGRLHRAPGAVTFSLPAFLVHADAPERDGVATVVDLLLAQALDG